MQIFKEFPFKFRERTDEHNMSFFLKMGMT